uniref:Conserved oligomeric Golgi complex subunit 8 n=1 Tax=Auxenochlorella protothecoides TaxID=3075 RepID=A0A1D2A6K0_AUXPR
MALVTQRPSIASQDPLDGTVAAMEVGRPGSSASKNGNRGTSEEEAAYFSQLLGYSMERLAREPELLASEQQYLARQAAEVTSTYRGALLASASGARDLAGILGDASTRLRAVSDALPRLQASGEAFEGVATSSEAARRVNRQLAAHHNVMLDILEVPSLMLTCVRNRHYDEALDLGAFVRKLETLHGGLPLVRRLAAEARAASAAMRGALLRRLEADVALPECLRAVGFLRRLACFGERELRLEFLVRREAWVATCAAQAEEEGGPAYESLRRATDGLRLHLHDVATQYCSVFGDGAEGGGGGGSAGGPAPHSDVLPTWAQRRAEAYVAHVRRQLPRLADGGALASVMEAAMYAGASLGRAGLDLRPLLAPAFEDAARGLLDAGLRGAEAGCLRLIAAGVWARRGPAAEGAAAPHDAPPAASTPAPPGALLVHPPLAAYCNGVCAALNELRHCALLVAAPGAAAALRGSLGRVAVALRAARDVPPDAHAALSSLLAPHLAAALARTFASTAHALGLDPAALARTLREEDDGAGGGDGDGGRCAAVGAQTGGTAGGGSPDADAGDGDARLGPAVAAPVAGAADGGQGSAASHDARPLE